MDRVLDLRLNGGHKAMVAVHNKSKAEDQRDLAVPVSRTLFNDRAAGDISMSLDRVIRYTEFVKIAAT